MYLAGSLTLPTADRPRLAVFGAKQTGAVSPMRVIENSHLWGGPQAVDALGNIWTSSPNNTDGDTAYLYGPAARGSVKPTSQVLLPITQTQSITLDKAGDVVYVSQAPECEIQVFVPGGAVKQTITEEGTGRECQTSIAVTF